MNLLEQFLVFFMCFPYCFLSANGKTIEGTMSSLTARNEKGQYMSSFCFHGMTAFKLDKKTFSVDALALSEHESQN